jgi:hypothetical protein
MNFISDILRIKEEMLCTIDWYDRFSSHRVTSYYPYTIRSLYDGKDFSEFMINKNKPSVLILTKSYQRFYKPLRPL